jgi:hypothetical protein
MGVTRLTITVGDITAAMASFDVIRIKRSVTGINGTYGLITDITPQPARLQPQISGPWAVVSKTLKFKVDSAPEFTIIFTGTNPLSAAQVAVQINALVGYALATALGTVLKLQSLLTGTKSKIEITGGEAAVLFGWSTGTRDIGEEAHIQLIAGQGIYNFTDDDGEPAYFYEAQYYNTANQLQSQDSAPFQGAVSTLISAGNLSTAHVKLVDGAGIAVPDQEITFYTIHEPFTVEGFQVALARQPITIKTNNAGEAQAVLVRGLKVKVVFEGTSVIREIQVPNTTSFDLLQQLGAAPDPFSVVELEYPAAPRRTI